MKAGRVSDNILYVIGVSPGGTSGVAIIGVHQMSVYRGQPGKIIYFDTYSVDGDYASQALEIADDSREFHPRVLVCESFRSKQPITSDAYLSPVKIGTSLEFCTKTNYVICPFYWQSAAEAQEQASDDDLDQWGLKTAKPGQERDATRHAITFIRRAKTDIALRDSAWGTEEARFGPRRRGTARPVRRLE